MRPADEVMTLLVEHVADVVVVRVAGELNATTADRMVRVLGSDVARAEKNSADPVQRSHVVVDLGEVRSFGTGGVEALRAGEMSCRRRGVTAHVTGVTPQPGRASAACEPAVQGWSSAT